MTSPPPNSILLDTRNNYESSIGYFQSPNLPTILTNTRQFSSIQKTYEDLFRNGELSGKNVFMFCTGGVRCESASKALVAAGEKFGQNVASCTSLEGGICKYLDEYGSLSESVRRVKEEVEVRSFFKGKNFVFDPRRFDPNAGEGSVGKCIVCGGNHDDYDHGKSFFEGGETRCVECRVLVLCCKDCSPSHSSTVKCGVGGGVCEVKEKKGGTEWKKIEE